MLNRQSSSRCSKITELRYLCSQENSMLLGIFQHCKYMILLGDLANKTIQNDTGRFRGV